MEQGKRLADEKDIYRMAAMAMGTRTPGFYPEAIGNVHKALVDQLSGGSEVHCFNSVLGR